MLLKIKNHLPVCTCLQSKLAFCKLKNPNIGSSTDQNQAEVASLDGSFNANTTSVRIDASSIFTNNSESDTHLHGADFFVGANHEPLICQGSILKQIKGSEYKLNGGLIIKGTSKEVTFDVSFGGIATDPWG
jgi:polyisoprenoid-binding protein YceI